MVLVNNPARRLLLAARTRRMERPHADRLDLPFFLFIVGVAIPDLVGHERRNPTGREVHVTEKGLPADSNPGFSLFLLGLAMSASIFSV